MITLRSYQQEAVEASIKSLPTYRRNVIHAPTGSGKGLLIAAIALRALKKGLRVLLLQPKGYLISQNTLALHSLQVAGGVSTESFFRPGIYCAGLNQKDTDNQIIFATRDSLGHNPTACGVFDLILIDECHNVPLNPYDQGGMYCNIFSNQDDPYVIGLTATPWRLNGGLIFSQKNDSFFSHCSYSIKTSRLITDGYLSPYIFPVSDYERARCDNLRIVRGDYVGSQLDSIMGDWDQIHKSIDTWNALASDRVCTLFFCCSVYHAKRLLSKLSELHHHKRFAYIDGSVTGRERTALLADIKRGVYDGVINVAVLIEGFDAPNIDCVMMLRPTASPSLHIQQVGRGLRLDPNNPDKRLLIIDVAGNFNRFGPDLDNPCLDHLPSHPKGGGVSSEDTSEMPVDLSARDCMQCGASIPEGVPRCHECNDFKNRELDIVHDPYTNTPTIYRVRSHHLESYVTKGGEECVRVHFMTEAGHFMQYLMIKHPGQFGVYNRVRLRGLANLSKSVTEVTVKSTKNPKYPDISYKFGSIERTYSSNVDECDHPWVVVSKSFRGKTYLKCQDCGKGMAWNG